MSVEAEKISVTLVSMPSSVRILVAARPCEYFEQWFRLIHQRTWCLDCLSDMGVVDDPVRLGAMGGLRLAMEVPEDMWKNLTLASR